MTFIQRLIAEFPIRRSKVQKQAFRDWLTVRAGELGYSARTERNGAQQNLVVGEPEKADVIFTAHYDTPAASFLPNVITPCNRLCFVAYQLLLVGVLALAGAAVGVPLALLTQSGSLGFRVGYVIYMSCLALMIFGPANRNNVNDNTSGVAAILEIMARIPEDNRSKTAFILFDNEEKGMLGSSAYASNHQDVRKNKLVINLDCVGDGEHILFFANRRTRALASFPKLEAAMASARGRHYIMNRMEKCIYPSDQSQFRHGIAVCACNRSPVVGYYCDKLHTRHDVVCDQANLDFLAEGLSDFVNRL